MLVATEGAGCPLAGAAETHAVGNVKAASAIQAANMVFRLKSQGFEGVFSVLFRLISPLPSAQPQDDKSRSKSSAKGPNCGTALQKLRRYCGALTFGHSSRLTALSIVLASILGGGFCALLSP
ncbi:hypothetical protein [Agrobacterium vitis]|uniref:hypothetical protein n=1 Tax=Agrobacterium vitis TaxID=373 RepID=UPI0018D236FB|nr:hypothetical protein [Agrobacterium vitis]